MKQGVLIFLMAAAAVAFGTFLKQCGAEAPQGPAEKKVSNP